MCETDILSYTFSSGTEVSSDCGTCCDSSGINKMGQGILLMMHGSGGSSIVVLSSVNL